MKDGKVKRRPMTKVERILKRMEKQEAAVQRLKELVDAPPNRLDQLLEKMGREPTFEGNRKISAACA